MDDKQQTQNFVCFFHSNVCKNSGIKINHYMVALHMGVRRHGSARHSKHGQSTGRRGRGVTVYSVLVANTGQGKPV